MSDHGSATRRNVLRATAAAGAVAFVGTATGEQGGTDRTELLVGVTAAADDHRAVVRERLRGGEEIVGANDPIRSVTVALPAEADETAKEQFERRLRETDHVKYVEENTEHEAFYTPNDPKYGDQYADQDVNANDAWDTTLGDSSVTVAVVDQGIKYDHPDLDGNMDGSVSNYGRDFVDDDADPYPDVLSDEYHGTHVAGIAAGETDNGEGATGIGNSSILSGRALSESGSGSTSDIADAITWAADQGAEVINLSLGGGGYTDTMKNAVSYAYDNGSLIVAAAGNDGTNNVSYPAAYSECLAVSALDPDGTLASYSNYGSEIELCAPGTDVLSTWTDDGYRKISGTSMATPVVGGSAGLTLAQWSLSNTELRTHLKDTAVDIGLSSDKQGSGRVDPNNAVDTDPTSGGGGGGGTCGDKSTTASVTGEYLADYTDDDCWSYAWNYTDPCQVEVELDGPSDADFDLYVNTGSGTCPSTSSYDYRSISTDSQETITVDNPDDSADLYVLVDSYDGSGYYDLYITEKST
ncbi:peptidase S8 [Halobacteriales archaeon QS_9_67_17]|nr:MAG: peptidase S8 [Halobacteriales archaeon QS_9_67_17]